MKKVLLISIVLLNSLFTYSQLLSRKVYQYEGQNRIGEMVLTSDGNLILPITYSMYIHKIHLLKTDITGEIIWEKTYGLDGNLYFDQISETPSGDFFMCGGYSGHSRTFLMKLNSSGDTLYTVLGNESTTISSGTGAVLSLDDQTLFIVNYYWPTYYPNPGWISSYIIDTLGNTIKDVGFNMATELKKIPVLKDSVITFNGWEIDYDESIIFQYSLNDSSLTSDYLGFNASDFIKNSDGSFYFSLLNNEYNSFDGYDIVKYNSQGEVEWKTDFDEENADTVCYSQLIRLYNDRLIVAGYMRGPYGFSYGLFIASTDTSGQLQSFYTNDDLSQPKPASMMIVDDRLLIYGTYKDEINESVNPFLDVYSTDSLLTSVKKVPRQHTPEISVFPNPTTGEFKVSYNIFDRSNDNVLTIYNLKGEKIRERKINGKNGHGLFDLKNSGKGVYLIRLTTNGIEGKSCKIVVK